MIIAALNEGGIETRVSITPSSIKQLLKKDLEVLIEKGAGIRAGFHDKSYELSQAAVLSSRRSLLSEAQILTTIDTPLVEDIKDLTSGSLLIAPIESDAQSKLIKWCLKNRISVFSPPLIPRISRAQNMDTLSSQSNLAGYRAVIEGVRLFHRAVPMMMTAAGMIKPAKILILGAGVAGLQAVATGKRLGAEVFVFDVRPSVKEQIESLGATFIEVSQDENAESTSGYAKEMSVEYQQKQAELIDEYARMSDIVITTALIPGKKAPILIKEDTINQMKPESIIIDLAASKGGNCDLCVPDEIIRSKQITIFGISNAARMIPATASELYANNIANILGLLITSDGHIKFNEQDEIIHQALICHDGQYMPFQPYEE